MSDWRECSPDLNPCPFCQSPAEQKMDGHYPVASCSNDDCVAHGYWVSEMEWNTRPREEALEKEVKELRQAKQYCFALGIPGGRGKAASSPPVEGVWKTSAADDLVATIRALVRHAKDMEDERTKAKEGLADIAGLVEWFTGQIEYWVRRHDGGFGIKKAFGAIPELFPTGIAAIRAARKHAEESEG